FSDTFSRRIRGRGKSFDFPQKIACEIFHKRLSGGLLHEMGNIFPRWTNLLAVKVLVCVSALGTCVIAVAWYSWTPKYTRVGYMPQQPIPFDHSLHAGQLGMDCR